MTPKLTPVEEDIRKRVAEVDRKRGEEDRANLHAPWSVRLGLVMPPASLLVFVGYWCYRHSDGNLATGLIGVGIVLGIWTLWTLGELFSRR